MRYLLELVRKGFSTLPFTGESRREASIGVRKCSEARTKLAPFKRHTPNPHRPKAATTITGTSRREASMRKCSEARTKLAPFKHRTPNPHRPKAATTITGASRREASMECASAVRHERNLRLSSIAHLTPCAPKLKLWNELVRKGLPTLPFAGVTARGRGCDWENLRSIHFLNTRVLGDRTLQLASIFVFSGG